MTQNSDRLHPVNLFPWLQFLTQEEFKQAQLRRVADQLEPRKGRKRRIKELQELQEHGLVPSFTVTPLSDVFGQS